MPMRTCQFCGHRLIEVEQEENKSITYYCEECCASFRGSEIKFVRDARKPRIELIINERTGETFKPNDIEKRIKRLRRRVWSWCDALKDASSGAVLKMLTLTYADADAWQANDIRDFMLRLRAALGDNILGYAWVLEIQKRGAPHYHVLVWCKAGTFIPAPDDAGMWSHGMTRVEVARTPFYVFKYSSKCDESSVMAMPAGARMFAVWIREGVISDMARYIFRMSSLGKWLADMLMPLIDEFPKRARGGGWLVGDDWVSSPFITIPFVESVPRFKPVPITDEERERFESLWQ